MLEAQAFERAQRARRKGRSASTQAGEFVREEIKHIRQGKHGARSAKQAIAIGLSKARRAGIPLAPPKKGVVSEETRRSAQRAYEAGRGDNDAANPRRSRAVKAALRREGRSAGSTTALSRQAHSASRKRSAA